MQRIAWLLALAFPLAITGCTGDPDDGEEPAPRIDAGERVADAGERVADAAPAVDGGQDAGPPLDVDACEHMIDGPSQAVTPAASREVDADDVIPSHVRWDSGFLSGPSGYSYGYVDLLVEQPGEIFIYSREGLDITLTDANGTERAAGSVGPTTCATPMQRRTFDLGAGTYKLLYGSFELPDAQLVVLRADDTGH
jgi:hypothetical protein